jgi:hypothetical protein
VKQSPPFAPCFGADVRQILHGLKPVRDDRLVGKKRNLEPGHYRSLMPFAIFLGAGNWPLALVLGGLRTARGFVVYGLEVRALQDFVGARFLAHFVEQIQSVAVLLLSLGLVAGLAKRLP